MPSNDFFPLMRNIFSDQWFHSRTANGQRLFIYLLINSDISGFVDVNRNIIMANLSFNDEISFKNAFIDINEKYLISNNLKRIWIKNYIFYGQRYNSDIDYYTIKSTLQKNTCDEMLFPNNKEIISQIQRIDELQERLTEDVMMRIMTSKNNVASETTDIERRVDNFEGDENMRFTNIGKKKTPTYLSPSNHPVPTLTDISDYLLLNFHGVVDNMKFSEKFYSHYSAQGWLIGNGIPMMDWKSKLDEWVKKSQEENESKIDRLAQSDSEFTAISFELPASGERRLGNSAS